MNGCNIGSSVITNPTGTYPLQFSPNSEWYNGQSIHIVTWSGDNQCGITNPYRFTGKTCIAGFPYRYGNVIEYTQADINCGLDSLLLLMPIVILGVLKIIKR